MRLNDQAVRAVGPTSPIARIGNLHLTQHRPWIDQAVCAQVGDDLWFPELGSNSGLRAKRICADCPVRTDCLQWALDNDERAGIWGGMSERERRKLKQPREVRQPVEPTLARCARCDSRFVARSKQNVYCSDRCRKYRDARGSAKGNIPPRAAA